MNLFFNYFLIVYVCKKAEIMVYCNMKHFTFEIQEENRMSSKNYYIMSLNTPVAKWENGNLTVLKKALLPLYLNRISDADMWLETRAIDSHRPNSRLLKKALRLTERDDISTVIYVNGATITDNYWIKEFNDDLTYDDVRFDNDYFSNLALKGSYNGFNRAANSKRTKTPELTNIGSFEKCWKLRGGKWWMYKRANHDEMFSELFVCRFGQALGMNMAVYERGKGFVKSLDFTDNASVNFEPASSFMGDNEDYEAVIAKLQDLCPKAIPDYILMIFLDTLVANPDRHTNNFGLLRDVKNGELLGLAPNFDNNMALIARGYPSMPKANDLLITLFNDVLEKHSGYRKYLPSLSVELVRGCVDDLHMKVKKDSIVKLIMSRYEFIGRKGGK